MGDHWRITCWSLNHAHPSVANAYALGLSYSRFCQIAGGIPPASQAITHERHVLRGLVNYVHLANGPFILEEGVR
jgi:hypothetical protein